MGLLSPDKRRGDAALSDLARSLAVIFVFVLATGVFFLFGRPHPDPVHVVDYRPQLAAARATAAYHVLAPAGLPPAWRATSVRDDRGGGHLTFHIGFLTPKGQYAGLDESDSAGDEFVRAQLGAHPQRLSSVTAGGRMWQQMRGARGELALVRAGGGPTVVVHGTSGMAELVTLAAALR